MLSKKHKKWWQNNMKYQTNTVLNFSRRLYKTPFAFLLLDKIFDNTMYFQNLFVFFHITILSTRSNFCVLYMWSTQEKVFLFFFYFIYNKNFVIRNRFDPYWWLHFFFVLCLGRKETKQSFAFLSDVDFNRE